MIAAIMPGTWINSEDITLRNIKRPLLCTQPNILLLKTSVYTNRSEGHISQCACEYGLYAALNIMPESRKSKDHQKILDMFGSRCIEKLLRR